MSRLGDLWVCGNRRNQHRVVCGDATSPDAVARLLGDRKPFLLVTDPPYGISLDSEWRDRAGLNGCGPAEASYMKQRTEGHTETTISGDTRADWSGAFELVPSLQIAYVWHASIFTAKCSTGWSASASCIRSRLSGTKAGRCSPARTTGISMSRAGMCEKRMLLGSARRGKTRPSGTRHHRSSLWADPTRRSTITQLRNR